MPSRLHVRCNYNKHNWARKS